MEGKKRKVSRKGRAREKEEQEGVVKKDENEKRNETRRNSPHLSI